MLGGFEDDYVRDDVEEAIALSLLSEKKEAEKSLERQFKMSVKKYSERASRYVKCA
jgi:hypothetical protein